MKQLPGLRGGSADSNGLWLNQFRRVARWKERTMQALEDASTGDSDDRTYDFLDYFLAYNINAHSLREWLLESPAVDRKALDDMLKEYPIWPICRDVANRSRHLELTHNPRDRDWMLKRSYDPFHSATGKAAINWMLQNRYDFLPTRQVVEEIWEMWSEVAKRLNLLPVKENGR